MDVLLTGQMDHGLHMADILIRKAGVGGLLHLVGIGAVIQHLLQLPQVLFRRHHINEYAPRRQHPAELLDGQGGKAVHQQVHRPVRHRQMIRRRHGELHVLLPLGGPAKDGLGDVRSRQGDAAPRPAQDLIDPAGVVPLAAAGVQHPGSRAGALQGDPAQGVPQGGVVILAQKGRPGGGHALVVAGHFRVHPVGGQQVDIALPGQVEAVPRRAGIGGRPPLQGPAADGTAE